MDIIRILNDTCNVGASDLHIHADCPPIVRVHGELQPLNNEPDVTNEELFSVIEYLFEGTRHMQTFIENGEVDFVYAVPGLCRFRGNAYREQGHYALVMRTINAKIPDFDSLGLPSAIKDLCHKKRGLVLVTGPTGSGKSTTLAAMIDYINTNVSTNIITIEDPIEYVHQRKQSLISQREVGEDTHSFANALRAALREDPDVILIGEMRDPETIGIALTAAETGHLVFSTLHTIGAAKTIDRIIDVFNEAQQQQVKMQLATVIQGIISQQLLKRCDRPGRVAAIELMLSTPAISNNIREGKTFQILSLIQTGAKLGMKSMDTALAELCRRSVITRQEALNYAVDAETLSRLLY